jgi:glycerol uptake facilitator protein
MNKVHDLVGELTGTFILVFFGCGAVAASLLFDSHRGLFQVAAVWGIGVALAIYATRHLSCAHLNPAVSLAMVAGRRMGAGRLPAYLFGQLLGAFLAAGLLFFILHDPINAYEAGHNITRGAPDSAGTAMIFADFFPNPGLEKVEISVSTAFWAESLGTFFLVFLIFALTEGCNLGRPGDSLSPLFIGMTVTSIISVLAPLTMAGINPARDLGPRLFAFLAGWGRAAFPTPFHAFFTVYIVGPCLGGVGGALFFTRILQPLMDGKREKEDCGCNGKF